MANRPADDFPFGPAAMRRDKAARYCGVSAGHFDRLVREGFMPAPRNQLGVKVWLRAEIDDALFALPTYGDEGGGNSCDVAFGV